MNLKDFIQYFISTSFLTTIIVFVGKILFEKLLTSTLDSKLSKEMELFKHEIDRKKIAYNIIINREFEFYEKINENLSNMLVNISNISVSNYKNSTEEEQIKVFDYINQFQENAVNIVRLSITYCPFLPGDIGLKLIEMGSEIVNIPIFEIAQENDNKEKLNVIPKIIGDMNRIIYEHLSEITR